MAAAAAAAAVESSVARRSALVAQCYQQLHGFLGANGIVPPSGPQQSRGGKGPKAAAAAAVGPPLCAPAAMKRFLRAMSLSGVFEPTDDVQAQRAAVRAAYIAMPVEICRLLTPGDLATVDAMLAEELSQQSLVEAMELPEAVAGSGLVVWQGDMSLLRCDAVVNPGNSALLGCFLPSHRCLDNILHAQSGPRLRLACAEMLEKLGIEEDANGNCRVTPAFGLPSRFVFHTVGPSLVSENHRGPPRPPTPQDAAELRQCYQSCLDVAQEHGLQSIAFCCISTGIFGYPQEEAASIAIRTCVEWRQRQAAAASNRSSPRIVFNVFKDEDLDVYNSLVPKIVAATQHDGMTDDDGPA